MENAMDTLFPAAVSGAEPSAFSTATKRVALSGLSSMFSAATRRPYMEAQ